MSTAETPSLTVNIPKHDITYTIPVRYTSGHVLTEAEAAALNQTLTENLRNNNTSAIEKLLKSKGEGSSLSQEERASLLTSFLEYAEGYEFSGRRSRTPVDPVAAEAYKLAKAKVIEQIKSKGHDIKHVPNETLEQYVSMVLEKYPAITEEARRRVEALKALGEKTVIDLPEPEPVAQAAE